MDAGGIGVMDVGLGGILESFESVGAGVDFVDGEGVGEIGVDFNQLAFFKKNIPHESF